MTSKGQRKPGPKPDTLVIEGETWGKAVKKALDKKPPAHWPERPTKKRKKRKSK